MDERIKIKACQPCGEGEFFVATDFNGNPSTGVFKESELSKEMRSVLETWFVEKFYQLPKDIRKRVVKDLK